ncbi:membrane protein [Azospirillaceae bacterium]
MTDTEKRHDLSSDDGPNLEEFNNEHFWIEGISAWGLESVSRFRHSLSDCLDFVAYAARRFYDDNCFQTASALTYTALLAMVPLMTIGFAIFSAFPVFSRLRNEAQTLLFTNLVPEVGVLVQDYLGRFMENAGQSTAFGVIGLAISAVLLLSTIETAFGAIWRVSEPRPIIIRFLSFWAILTLAPLLFGASLSLSSTVFTRTQLANLDAVTAPFGGAGVFLPGVFEFMGLSMLYVIIPNRAVQWMDAVWGGLMAAGLLEGSKACFIWYLRTFPAYQTIYGALSTVPIFLLWVYIAWSTVLFGAVITAALPEWHAGKLMRHSPGGLMPAPRLAVALSILNELLQASRMGGGRRRRQLVDRIPVGSAPIEAMLEQLRAAEWVARTTKDFWVLTRDLSEATLFDLLKALGIGLRGSTMREVVGLDTPWRDRCTNLLETAEASDQVLLGVTLKDLLLGSGPGGEHRQEGAAVHLLSSVVRR